MKKITLIAAIIGSQILLSCGNTSIDKKQTTQTTEDHRTILDSTATGVLYKSEDLIIRKISSNVYEHTSFLMTNDSDRLSCNGMIVVNEDEAVIFNTPTSDQTSIELIEYLRDRMNLLISAVVITNFYVDYPGGLQVFHKYGISSYASNATIKLAQKNKSNIPQHGFDKQSTLKVGKKKIYLEHLGEGITSGNTIGYFSNDQVKFGGSLIRD